ncbi:hypothetical protein HYDPIDRAFT_29636 [Hydnomerulius pinastri MD-312]|uniref:Shugoshin C-terminal domain-containing protein n=1 Tax=Hydnomerulius pinastri MD-312 TaxID=994086 RepID=A0A0C9W7U7_9AGAM|nr:hypothetical protein HYDPIDRAFT_29636 [Hydnomerulius pinastri MD-312]
MSRRDSRVSLNIRQNDALTEFENFKKKFLLANKHITKLNSTLSVRIEELQAQISTLYVENLRLRASEIALAAQLKKEQEKSRKVLADAEAATSNLSKHLGFLRQSFHVAPGAPSPKLESRPATKARRPAPEPNASPQMPRLSRAPNVPGIYEDEEIASSAEADEDDAERVASPTVRRKSKDRLSASRLPLPSRVASPPPLPTPLHVNLAERESSTKRKTGRRQSGLLSVNTNVGTSGRSERGERVIPPRAASPAFGSPVRRDAGLAEDEEERQVDELLGSGAGTTEDTDFVTKARKEKKEKKAKQAERDVTPEDTDGGTSRVRERKRRKEEDYSGLKDVTNSPRSRALLPPLDTNTSDRDQQHTPETDGPTPTSAATSAATSRTFLSTPLTTPATTPQPSQLPTPRTSSPVPPGAASASESEAPPGGRERRTRKSVNYAEPKLNTKMRKPDPVPSAPVTTVPKKRISGASTQSDDPEPRSSLDGPPRREAPSLQPSAAKPSTSSSSSSAGGPSIKRKKSRPYVPVDDDDDESDGTQADAEYGSLNGWVNLDGRRRSAQNGSTSGSSTLRRVLEADDARRHSFAV